MSRPTILTAFLLVLCLSGFAAAEDGDKDVVAKLKARAEQHHEKASDLFASLADYKGGEDEGRRLRTETRQHVDAAIVALDTLIEQYPDEEKWAEKMLEQVYSISFWLGRFSMIDDFDYYANTRVGQATSSKSRNESAQVAIANAEAAEDSGDSAAAFYEYMDVIKHHAKEDTDGAVKARTRLKELRGSLTTGGILAFLKTELRSDIAERRAFAAKEMATLRTSQAARPLSQALKIERNEDTRDAILKAFHFTQKRTSGKELANLAKSKDGELKLKVLTTLLEGVGGRHGADAALRFVKDKNEKVAERAISVMTSIGGVSGASALGKAACKARKPERTRQLFDCLVSIGNERAAAVLIPYCSTKGRYQEYAEDSLVRMGAPAIFPCINALANRRLAKNVHYVLKRITGQTFGQSQSKWSSWWVRRQDQGNVGLPQFKRGQEPWLGWYH